MNLVRKKGEEVNFLTHAFGFFAWIVLGTLLVLASLGLLPGQAKVRPMIEYALACGVYALAVMFLFAASSLYHRNKREENERSIWRTLDHTAIFVMIAGSYTPVIALCFDEGLKIPFYILMWGIAALGLGLKIFAPRAPRWLSTVLYVAMGWVIAFVLVPLYSIMVPAAFWAMVAGGLLYTAGALIYAFKRPNPWPGRFGFHEIFHVFILAAAGVQFFMVWWSLMGALG